MKKKPELRDLLIDQGFPRHRINLNNPPGKKKIQATLSKVNNIWTKGKERIGF